MAPRKDSFAMVFNALPRANSTRLLSRFMSPPNIEIES
jgi:hypothetical protein